MGVVLFNGRRFGQIERLALGHALNDIDQDHIAEFMAERMEPVPGRVTRKQDVFEEFKEWHQAMHGTKGPTANDLYKAITKRYGNHDKKVNGWPGVWLRHEGETGVPMMGEGED